MLLVYRRELTPSRKGGLMHENAIAKVVVDVAYQLHTHLGPGLLESVYEAVMLHELRKRGLHVESQIPVPVQWDTIKLEIGFRADLVVEDELITELKSVENNNANLFWELSLRRGKIQRRSGFIENRRL